MTHGGLRIGFLAALCCVRVPGQTAEPDCGNATLEHQAPVRTQMDDWLESLDRRPCVSRSATVRQGVVSARSLAHKPSPKARKEFDRGMRARQNGLGEEAVQHFAAAGRLDPDFVDAHLYAGLVYVEARQPSLALPYYQQAVLLEPVNATVLSNLAGVLIALDRPGEAESAARRAVQQASSSVTAHFMLGLALFQKGQTTQETASHLTIAAEKYPLARQMLEWIQPILASPAPSASVDAGHF